MCYKSLTVRFLSIFGWFMIFSVGGICQIKPAFAQQMDLTSPQILAQLDKGKQALLQAFLNVDTRDFLAVFTPDAICLIDQLPPAIGAEQVGNIFEDATTRFNLYDLRPLDRRVWAAGEYVYEVGRYAESFRLPGEQRFIFTDFKKYLTIWQRQADGNYRILVETSNPDVLPSATQLQTWQMQSPQPVQIGRTPKATTLSSNDRQSLFDQVKEREAEFHACFIKNDVEPAIDTYTDDALLLVMNQNWLQGKTEIGMHIRDGMQKAKLTDDGRTILAIGGDDHMVYVINRFHWQFTTPAAPDQVQSMTGKGVHLWQRQPDGSWKILIDIYNLSPPATP